MLDVRDGLENPFHQEYSQWKSQERCNLCNSRLVIRGFEQHGSEMNSMAYQEKEPIKRTVYLAILKEAR